MMLFVAVLLAADEQVSCSAASFHLLAKEQGLSIPLDAVAESLPVSDEGWTGARVIRVGIRHALYLQSRKLEVGDPLPNTAFVAHRGRMRWDGHYFLVRPVPNEGGFFQVIDPPRAPRIVSEREYWEDKRLTGWVLVPLTTVDRLWDVAAYAITAVIIGAIGFVVLCRSFVAPKPIGPPSKALR